MLRRRLTTINQLFLQTQPAHLQRALGKTLDGEARKAKAEFDKAWSGADYAITSPCACLAPAAS